jgi:hypothetical protein
LGHILILKLDIKTSLVRASIYSGDASGRGNPSVLLWDKSGGPYVSTSCSTVLSPEGEVARGDSTGGVQVWGWHYYSHTNKFVSSMGIMIKKKIQSI